MRNDNDNADDTELFTIVPHAGRERLIFTTAATLRARVPGSLPLWWHEPRDEAGLSAISVWLAEHRHLWPAWREIAERDGIQAVTDEIGRLWSAGPIESCDSMMLSRGDDLREVALLAMLVTRNVELVRHRFKTAARAQAFADWYLRDVSGHAPLLFFEGTLIGPRHLARVLERVASAELADRRQARARRASGRGRRAA